MDICESRMEVSAPYTLCTCDPVVQCARLLRAVSTADTAQVPQATVPCSVLCRSSCTGRHQSVDQLLLLSSTNLVLAPHTQVTRHT